MEIEIVTTPNDDLKETGFGTHKACTAIMHSLTDSGQNAIVTVCRNAADLTAVVARKPDIVVLAVKYIPKKTE